MELYHFTSTYHLPEIIKNGITKGQVPLPGDYNLGINGIWLTANNNNNKQIWTGSGSLNKAKIRITLNIDQDNPYLFKWDRLSSLLKFKKHDIAEFNSHGDGAKYWYVYLGKITTDAFANVKIFEDGVWSLMQTGNLVNKYSHIYVKSHSLSYNICPIPAVVQNIINERTGKRKY